VLDRRAKSPFVILMVGLNGSGRPRPSANCASLYRQQGLKVMLAAGRHVPCRLPIERLQVSGQRAGAAGDRQNTAGLSEAACQGLAFEAVERAEGRRRRPVDRIRYQRAACGTATN